MLNKFNYIINIKKINKNDKYHIYKSIDYIIFNENLLFFKKFSV